MSYFSIEDYTVVKNKTGNFGFIPAGVDPTQIEDASNESGNALNKMGSSIPSPYARLYLFSAAFRQVNKEEGNAQGQGHLGVIDEAAGQRVPSPYHYLVSEWLDMMEFLFVYGQNPNFSIVDWNVTTECEALRNDRDDRHSELADALKAAHDNDSTLMGENSIYLFLWKDKVIGGTSPVSLVYTSPNINKVLNGEVLVGGKANRLFDRESATPLHERSEEFRRFLYAFGLLELEGRNSCTPLSKYLSDSRDNYDQILKDRFGLGAEPEYDGIVDRLSFEGGLVSVAGVPLFTSKNEVDPTMSDYVMKPTVAFYRTEVVDGRQVTNVPTPMVLTDRGLDDEDAVYLNGRSWNRDSDKIGIRMVSSLSERKLPGTESKYPFVTVDDFFEEKIIEVSYNLRSGKFVTGNRGNISVLLPLKKEFFKFFTLRDLIDENGIETGMLSLNMPDEDHVEAVLNIPLVHGHTIQLRKTYSRDNNEIVDCYEASNTFDLAFFPFYKLAPDANGRDNNVYNIMLGSTTSDVSCHFYSIDKLSSNQPELSNVKTTKRMDDSNMSTTHIHLDGSFDIMEVVVDGISGLIIPNMQEINASRANTKFHFCIDFGTTNTHVAFAKKNIGDNRITKTDIHPFEISSQDMQVVTLHGEGGVAEFVKFTTYLQREFVPLLIGEKNKVSFPLRTNTCQVDYNVTELDMFANMNIGFNYNEELSTEGLSQCVYYTNIKWDRKDRYASGRLREYFKEILWMMKNKAVLNSGTEDFVLVYTYPQSMSDAQVSDLREAWQSAKEVVKSSVELTEASESITPYYSFLSEMNYGSSYANFDIGGGTTDILYVNPENREAISLSAFFAANDLWGDGADPMSDPNSSGFISYYRKSTDYKTMSIEQQSTVNAVIQNSQSSADVMSYLFSQDANTHVSHAIQANEKMMQLLVVHMSSLAYYLAYAVDLGDLRMPELITFTGMGSKYIKLISGQSKTIGKLLSSVFRYYGRLMKNDNLARASVDVKFASGEEKVVTAQGGLIQKRNLNPLIPDSPVFYGYDGEEGDKAIRYSDLSNREASVLDFYNSFLDLFADQDFLDILDDIDLNVDEEVLGGLRRYASSSYKLMNTIPQGSERKKVKEPLFFWPLKNAIYQVAKDLSANN